jgi:hypothetical protein
MLRSASGSSGAALPCPGGGGGEQTAQARRLVFLRKALLFGIDGIKTRHRLRAAASPGEGGPGISGSGLSGVRRPQSRGRLVKFSLD